MFLLPYPLVSKVSPTNKLKQTKSSLPLLPPPQNFPPPSHRSVFLSGDCQNSLSGKGA